MNLNDTTKSRIRASIREAQEIINSKVLESHNPFWNSSISRFLIIMRDLIKKSEKYLNKRIDFMDDVKIDLDIKDVTDLITYYRNAVCHPEADNLTSFEIDNSKVETSFNVIFGKGNLLQIGSFTFDNEYEDDVAINFADKKLLLKRHLIRAFCELKLAFDPHLT